jgi:homoserine O-acetyltransferase
MTLEDRHLENEYYTQAEHGEFELFDLGDFELASGERIPDCKLAYTTHGKLNQAKDNVVVFPHMYSGTHRDMEMYVGEDMAIDPKEYFVIMPNQLGNGLSTSPHNTPPQDGGMGNFPDVNIEDDIRAQHRLVTEEFGIEEVQLVLGWSMGAQQTYEWAVRYPEMVKRAAPIAGTAKVTPHDQLFIDAHMEAIRSDPAWNDGFYDDPHAVITGLKRHAQIWSVMGLCTQFYHYEERAWERAGFTSVEDLMANFWEDWFLRMDPNNLLTMARKWQHGDVSRNTGGDLEAALGRIEAKTFVMPFEEDMFFPVDDCAHEESLIPDSELRPIPSLWGHFTMFGIFEEDKQAIDDNIRELLETPV